MQDRSIQLKIWAKVLGKAWSDKKYLERLRSNPDHVLKEEGFEIPKNFHCEVVEDSKDTIHFIIPQKPDGNLSETELKKLAAGMICGPEIC